MPSHLRNLALLGGLQTLLACGGLAGEPRQSPEPSHQSVCASLQEAIHIAALEEAACTTDSDCGIRTLPVCGLPGIDCYRHITHEKARTAELDRAIAAYLGEPCMAPKCECAAGTPMVACVEGRCATNPPAPGQ